MLFTKSEIIDGIENTLIYHLLKSDIAIDDRLFHKSSRRFLIEDYFSFNFASLLPVSKCSNKTIILPLILGSLGPPHLITASNTEQMTRIILSCGSFKPRDKQYRGGRLFGSTLTY